MDAYLAYILKVPLSQRAVIYIAGEAKEQRKYSRVVVQKTVQSYDDQDGMTLEQINSALK